MNHIDKQGGCYAERNNNKAVKNALHKKKE